MLWPLKSFLTLCLISYSPRPPTQGPRPCQQASPPQSCPQPLPSLCSSCALCEGCFFIYHPLPTPLFPIMPPLPQQARWGFCPPSPSISALVLMGRGLIAGTTPPSPSRLRALGSEQACGILNNALHHASRWVWSTVTHKLHSTPFPDRSVLALSYR